MKVHQYIGSGLEEYASQAKSISITAALVKDKALDILSLAHKSCKVRLILSLSVKKLD